MSENPPAGWYPDSTGTTRWWDGDQWTEQTPPPPATTEPPPAASMTGSAPPTGSRDEARTPEPRKKRRVFLWVFLLVQVLFIIWIVAGVSTGAGTPTDCEGLDEEACNAASDVGTSIGVALIIGLWVVVDFLLAVIYGVYRLATRR